MKVLASTVELVGSPKGRPKPQTATSPTGSALVELRPRSVPYSSVAQLASKLGVDPASVLDVIGIADRTAARRREEGFLKPAEADRLLRVARVLEEATRIFGS